MCIGLSTRCGARQCPPLGLAALLLLAPLTARGQVPADGWVTWQSNRQDSRVEIYLARASGADVKRLTTAGGQRPRFAPDGRWIAYQGIAGQEQRTLLVRPDGSGQKALFDGVPRFWLHDNSGLVCEQGGGFYLVDPDTATHQLLFKKQDFGAIGSHTLLAGGVTHDGRYLLAGTDLYRQGYSGDNGSFTASFAAVVLDLKHPERVYFFGDGCWPFTPPVGQRIYHICGNCPTKPDIYRMELGDLQGRASYAPEKAHPDADWGHEYNPDISNDGRWVAYMASTGCHAGYTCDYEIFIHQLGADVKQRARVTEEPRFDGYPSIHVGPLWHSDAPWLTLIPSRLWLEGRASQTRSITLRNGGSGTLGQASVTVRYEAGAPTGWIQAALSGTADQQQVQLTVQPGQLAAGEHHARIEVTVPGVQSTPLICPLTLSLQDGTPTSDAGSAADAGADARAGLDAGGPPDAGATAVGGGGGCGLASAPSMPAGTGWAPGPPGWFLALLVPLLALGRRRRRRRRA